METRPPNKPFWMVPFSIHATRGLLRDQKSRRKAMTLCLVMAVVLSIAGFTVLRPWLDPHEHPWRVVLYWLVVGWETILVLLLALFDMLMLRAQGRAARKSLQHEIAKRAASKD